MTKKIQIAIAVLAAVFCFAGTTVAEEFSIPLWEFYASSTGAATANGSTSATTNFFIVTRPGSANSSTTLNYKIILATSANDLTFAGTGATGNEWVATSATITSVGGSAAIVNGTGLDGMTSVNLTVSSYNFGAARIITNRAATDIATDVFVSILLNDSMTFSVPITQHSAAALSF